MSVRVRIATRGSRLALTQSESVAQLIRQARPEWTVELVSVRTAGDRFVNRPLSEIGGKGLFVKEIEEVLLRGEAECAVHSAKDLPARLTERLVIAAVPPRADVEDVLVTPQGHALHELPPGCTLGTSSPRRAALLRWLRPDVQVVPLRGNVETRLEKMTRGEVDGVLLALAGLRRLGISNLGMVRLNPAFFLPAVGQGALVVETRADVWAEQLRFLHDAVAGFALAAERAFLSTIGGTCHTSVGTYSIVEDGNITLHGVVADPNGHQIVRGVCKGTLKEATSVGMALGHQLLACGASQILAGDRPSSK
ncbi:MAG: hydroxymethylbilane synthase [Candidatus Binatia bacterium]|nr:hydroxymethylbilane synthase [Candidatus Binatia bacterium]